MKRRIQTEKFFTLNTSVESFSLSSMLSIKNISISGMIAAIYVALTLINPLSFGAVQFRISEAMTVLPILFPQSILGLFVGVVVSNFFSPVGIWDIVFGSLATLIAAYGTYFFRKNVVLALLSPVVVNGVIIGCLLYFTGIVPVLYETMLSVAFGELVVVFVLGLPLLKALDKINFKLH